MNGKEKGNIGWVDLLRVLACFFVVFSHCCDGFVGQFDANRQSFLTGVFSGSLARPCVPLFVMMTGVLLLPVGKEYTLQSFYKKRIGRILTPLVFWSLALPTFAFLYFNYVSPDTHNPLLSTDNYTVHTWLQRLYTFVFSFNFDTVPFWYLYMLIGLYLLMPILSSWLVQASQKDIRTVLILWGISLFLPYIKMAAPFLGYQGNYGNMDILGVCDWNSYGTFYYFSGFIGYLILAYYLTHYPLNWSWKKTWLISVPMFLIGYLITSVGYIITQKYYPGNYAYLEIVWYFAGINVFMMTFPVFVIIQKTRISFLPWLSRMASMTFGIYLCHYTFVFMAYDLFDFSFLPYWMRIICMACTTFGVCYLLVSLLSKSKLTARLVK